MSSQFIDINAPRYSGSLPKPRGLLPVPTEVAQAVSQEQARLQPNCTDVYATSVRDAETLTYHF